MVASTETPYVAAAPSGLTAAVGAAPPPGKNHGEPVQTENTAPPGLIVIVGSHGEPQGRYRWVETVTAAFGSAAVSVPEVPDTATAPSGSLPTASDQVTRQPAAPLPLR